jgi:hypothetical protein
MPSHTEDSHTEESHTKESHTKESHTEVSHIEEPHRATLSDLAYPLCKVAGGLKYVLNSTVPLALIHLAKTVIMTVSKDVVAQASGVIKFVDNIACPDMEHIGARIPVPKEDTTSLLQTTSHAGVCLLDREATYLATFSPIWSVMEGLKKVCTLQVVSPRPAWGIKAGLVFSWSSWEELSSVLTP